MFKIYDGREHFYQWDSDCKLIIDDGSISAVHFCNRTLDCAIVCNVYKENGQYLVNVPNIFFQSDRDLHVYAYDDNHTLYEETYKVCARSKPADYVYKDDEVLTWARIEQRMTDLENTVSTEGIAQIVQDYFKENPIEVGATQEQVNQINTNTSAINDIKENYAKKTDIPDVSGYLTEIPAEYVTDTELNAKGYATTDDVATAVSDKVTMEDVHNATAGFVSQAYVDEKIAAIPEPDLSGYALKTEIPDVSGFITEIPAEYITESELNAKGYLTEHQSLAEYSTTTQVQNMIDTAIAGITDGEAVSY